MAPGRWCSLRLRPSPLAAQNPPTNTDCMMSSQTSHFSKMTTFTANFSTITASPMASPAMRHVITSKYYLQPATMVAARLKTVFYSSHSTGIAVSSTAEHFRKKIKQKTNKNTRVVFVSLRCLSKVCASTDSCGCCGGKCACAIGTQF